MEQIPKQCVLIGLEIDISKSWHVLALKTAKVIDSLVIEVLLVGPLRHPAGDASHHLQRENTTDNASVTSLRDTDACYGRS